ncbi:MAG TPA: hypothetical protein VGM84_28275 [Steroidobacteraceae bacterium]|jgi:hypothetical protein
MTNTPTFGAPNVGEVLALDHLGVLRAHGPDAIRFLQGQLSHDISKLGPRRSLLAGYHNPQGRAIALLRLVYVADDDVLAILPRELIPVVVSRLSKVVLRAKVKIADASSEWTVSGHMEAPGHSAALAARVDSSPRVLVLEHSPGTGERPRGDRSVWHRLDIAAGLPQVYASTSEEFVAQMLNLDVLDGIAFDKGCYTGQEVIARAHYRGKVKRRLQRFVTTTPLAPGTDGRLADGRAFKVVDAVALPDGRYEFLAVTPTATGAPDESPSAVPVTTADSLPLPYELPA